MVGVPRSKGCVRCRKQKKGCDLKRPSCANCARISSVCIYEAKKVQFIPSTTPGVQSTALTKPSKAKASLQPWCLDKTALELEAEDAFWTAYLPNGGRDPTVGLDSTTSWSPLIRKFAHQDGLTRLAFQALSLTALGRLRDDPRLIRQGSELYTRSLRRMNTALKQPERVGTDHILATAQLLSTYEIFRGETVDRVSSQGADWQRHINGSLHLAEMRQKNAAATEDSQALLRHARESAIMSGGILGRPITLLLSKDQHGPEGSTDEIQDELFELLYQTPGLLNDIDGCLRDLAASKEGDESRDVAIKAAIDVLQNTADFARGLYAWEVRTFDRCQKGAYPGPGSASKVSSEKHNLFAICRDHGYGLFRTVMFYCWAVVPCYAKAWLTYRYLLQLAGYEKLEELTTLPLLPTLMDPHPYALHICTNISHFFRPEAGLWGAQQAVLPMGTALFYFAAHNSFATPEPRQMMADFAASKGATVVAEFVRSVAALAAPEGFKDDMENPNKLRSMARQWFGFHYTDAAS